MRVLNVGGGTKAIAIPVLYNGWEHVLLDISPAGKPDILADARDLWKQPAAQYDALYCSHNLEHFYPHDAFKVLSGFRHVLKPGGFAHIVVPDVGQVMRDFVHGKLEIDAPLYEVKAGPITVHDVLYGYGKAIAQSGQDFYAHKMGFTPSLLSRMLRQVGFQQQTVRADPSNWEIEAFAYPIRKAEAA
jgi:ubiquinone/menaquinone biosynthesis C-methylase UbiE